MNMDKACFLKSRKTNKTGNFIVGKEKNQSQLKKMNCET